MTHIDQTGRGRSTRPWGLAVEFAEYYRLLGDARSAMPPLAVILAHRLDRARGMCDAIRREQAGPWLRTVAPVGR